MGMWLLRARRLLAPIAVGAIALLAATVASAAPPTLDDFLAPQEIRSASISPDGTRIATVERVGAKFMIKVASVAPGETPPAIFRTGDYEPVGVHFAKTDRLIVGIIVWVDFFSMGKIPYVRIVSVDPTGKNVVTLFERSQRFGFNNRPTGILHHLPKSRDEILMAAADEAQNYSVYRVNVKTGAAKLTETGTRQTVAWLTDQDGAPRVRVDEDYRQRVRQIFTKAPRGDSWGQIAEYTLDAAPPLNVLAVTGNPEIVLLRANLKHDKAGLHHYNLRTNKITERVYQREDYDTIGAISTPTHNLPLGAFFLGVTPTADFFDDAVDRGVLSALSRLGPNTSTVDFDQSFDKSRWVIRTIGPGDPGSFHYFDFKTGALSLIGHVLPSLSARDLARMEAYSYKARDGLAIPAYLTIPAGRDAKKLPLIVMPHGGPEARDVMAFDPTAQFIASLGYAVFQPNFRGSSGYGRRYAEMGYGEWGGKMQDDLIDGLDDLIRRGIADADKICFVGGSYGGYAALAAAMLTPKKLKCAVGVAGVYDLPDIVETARRQFGALSPTYAYVTRMIGRWPEDGDKLVRLSPARNAAKIPVPALLVHGRHDDVAPVTQGRKMHEALKAAGKPVAYVELPNSGHGDMAPDDLRAWLMALGLFLDRHLGAEVSALDSRDIPVTLTSRGLAERLGTKRQPALGDAGPAPEQEFEPQLPVHRETFMPEAPFLRNE